MFVRRISIFIGMTAVLALAVPAASAAEPGYQDPANPPTVITPPPVAPPVTTPSVAEATPGASDADVQTQPVSGDYALGNAAAAVDDQTVQVVLGGTIAAADLAPAARASGAQLPFTGVGLGGLALAGVLLLASGCVLARSGRRHDEGAAPAQH